MDTNERIDKMLSKICNSERYCCLLQDSFDEDKDWQEYLSILKIMHFDYGLITKAIGLDKEVFLTPFGQKVCKKGGWIKYSKYENKKELFGYKLSSFQYYTFWVLFIIAIITFIYSSVNYFIDRKSDKVKTQSHIQEQTKILDTNNDNASFVYL